METFFALLALCAGNSSVSVNSPHKGQWRGALMFTLICARINDWVNNREAGDLRRHLDHYDVIVMRSEVLCRRVCISEAILECSIVWDDHENNNGDADKGINIDVYHNAGVATTMAMSIMMMCFWGCKLECHHRLTIKALDRTSKLISNFDPSLSKLIPICSSIP